MSALTSSKTGAFATQHADPAIVRGERVGGRTNTNVFTVRALTPTWERFCNNASFVIINMVIVIGFAIRLVCATPQGLDHDAMSSL